MDKCQEAYSKGVEDSKNAGAIDIIGHAIWDIIESPIPKTKEDQSYETGYHGKK